VDLHLYLSTYKTCVVLQLVSIITVPKMMMVCLEDLIRFIFEELDHVWLKSMWDGEENTHHDMIKIVHLLYLLKTWP
jgi:hypothetical protein